MTSTTDNSTSTDEAEASLMIALSELPLTIQQLEQRERVIRRLKEWLLPIPYYAQRQKEDPEYLASLASSFHSI